MNWVFHLSGNSVKLRNLAKICPCVGQEKLRCWVFYVSCIKRRLSLWGASCSSAQAPDGHSPSVSAPTGRRDRRRRVPEKMEFLRWERDCAKESTELSWYLILLFSHTGYAVLFSARKQMTRVLRYLNKDFCVLTLKRKSPPYFLYQHDSFWLFCYCVLQAI